MSTGQGFPPMAYQPSTPGVVSVPTPVVAPIPVPGVVPTPGPAPVPKQAVAPVAVAPVAVASGRTADVLGSLFYVTVAAIALAGQVAAASSWLHWRWVFAVPAVGALELGGIALAARADFRRRLGESAVAARVLSAAVAVFAVVFNWVGHGDRLAGGFFAGMSALGYSVWLINSGDRRRDQLRAAGKLGATPPVYGLVRWVRQPWLTRRARSLAVADPSLGLHGSLSAAVEQVRVERRRAAIAKALARKLSKGLDPVSAEIAIHTYDLDRIAAGLAEGADYAGLTALLAADLTPARLTAPVVGAVAPVSPAGPVAALPVAAASSGSTRVTATASVGRRPSSADRVAKAAARMPQASPAQIAAKLGLSERTVQRHMPARAGQASAGTAGAASDAADAADTADTAGGAAGDEMTSRLV
jgi:hypothetical protein